MKTLEIQFHDGKMKNSSKFMTIYFHSSYTSLSNKLCAYVFCGLICAFLCSTHIPFVYIISLFSSNFYSFYFILAWKHKKLCCEFRKLTRWRRQSGCLDGGCRSSRNETDGRGDGLKDSEFVLFTRCSSIWLYFFTSLQHTTIRKFWIASFSVCF